MQKRNQTKKLQVKQITWVFMFDSHLVLNECCVYIMLHLFNAEILVQLTLCLILLGLHSILASYG